MASSDLDDVGYASPEEILDFCNKVRKAGGGDIIDHLLPSVPQESDSCLIARGLNFNCAVLPCRADHLFLRSIPSKQLEGYGFQGSMEVWVMFCDKEVAEEISSALDLALCSPNNLGTLSPAMGGTPFEYGVLLPKRIGAAAAEFDSFLEDTSWNDASNHPFYKYLEESLMEQFDRKVMNV